MGLFKRKKSLDVPPPPVNQDDISKKLENRDNSDLSNQIPGDIYQGMDMPLPPNMDSNSQLDDFELDNSFNNFDDKKGLGIENNMDKHNFNDLSLDIPPSADDLANIPMPNVSNSSKISMSNSQQNLGFNGQSQQEDFSSLFNKPLPSEQFRSLNKPLNKQTSMQTSMQNASRFNNGNELRPEDLFPQENTHNFKDRRNSNNNNKKSGVNNFNNNRVNNDLNNFSNGGLDKEVFNNSFNDSFDSSFDNSFNNQANNSFNNSHEYNSEDSLDDDANNFNNQREQEPEFTQSYKKPNVYQEEEHLFPQLSQRRFQADKLFITMEQFKQVKETTLLIHEASFSAHDTLFRVDQITIDRGKLCLQIQEAMEQIHDKLNFVDQKLFR